MDDKTIQFATSFEDKNSKRILLEVYQALEVKGYNPAGQIVGYILSGDPTYITSFQGARQKIVKLDRYELLAKLLEHYLFEGEKDVRKRVE